MKPRVEFRSGIFLNWENHITHKNCHYGGESKIITTTYSQGVQRRSPVVLFRHITSG
jgi:hypothetical protein